MTFADLGGGSTVFGLILLLFAAIAAFNLGIGCLLTIERILKTFHRKLWMYLYIVVTSIGVVVLKKVLSRL